MYVDTGVLIEMRDSVGGAWRGRELHRRGQFWAKPWRVERTSLEWRKKGIILKAMVNLIKKFPAGNWQDQVWILERWFCWTLVDSVEARSTGREEKDPLTVWIIKSEPDPVEAWTESGTIGTEDRFKIYWQGLGLVKCRRWKPVGLDEFKVSAVGDC